MGIKVHFTESDIRNRLNAFVDNVEQMQIDALCKLGEMCVSHAKDLPRDVGFADHTGNLRSSIGYAVFKNGTMLHSGYTAVTGVDSGGNSLNGSEGVTVGEELAKQVGADTQGLSLVVTAGMHYAVYVEAKGRDVITGAEHLATQTLPEVLEGLLNDIKGV
mgnify:CR=1 FL=1